MVNLNEKKLLSKEAKDLLGNLKPYKNKKNYAIKNFV